MDAFKDGFLKEEGHKKTKYLRFMSQNHVLGLTYLFWSLIVDHGMEFLRFMCRHYTHLCSEQYIETIQLSRFNQAIG